MKKTIIIFSIIILTINTLYFINRLTEPLRFNLVISSELLILLLLEILFSIGLVVVSFMKDLKKQYIVLLVSSLILFLELNNANLNNLNSLSKYIITNIISIFILLVILTLLLSNRIPKKYLNYAAFIPSLILLNNIYSGVMDIILYFDFSYRFYSNFFSMAFILNFLIKNLILFLFYFLFIKHITSSSIRIRLSIPIRLVFVILTFGIYLFFWRFEIIKNITIENKFNEKKIIKIFLLSLFIPFYFVYWLYINEMYYYLIRKNTYYTKDKSLIYLIISTLGFNLVNYIMIQTDLDCKIPYNLSSGGSNPSWNATYNYKTNLVGFFYIWMC